MHGSPSPLLHKVVPNSFKTHPGPLLGTPTSDTIKNHTPSHSTAKHHESSGTALGSTRILSLIITAEQLTKEQRYFIINRLVFIYLLIYIKLKNFLSMLLSYVFKYGQRLHAAGTCPCSQTRVPVHMHVHMCTCPSATGLQFPLYLLLCLPVTLRGLFLTL